MPFIRASNETIEHSDFPAGKMIFGGQARTRFAYSDKKSEDRTCWQRVSGGGGISIAQSWCSSPVRRAFRCTRLTVGFLQTKTYVMCVQSRIPRSHPTVAGFSFA